MKSCPFCAEKIQDAAVKCRYCLSDLREAGTLGAIPPPRGKPPAEAVPNQQPTIGTVRAGMMIVGIEAFYLAVVLGLHQGSWAVGIFWFLGIYILLNKMAQLERFEKVFAGLIGVAWGTWWFGFVEAFEWSTATAWAAAIFAGVLGFLVHIAAFRAVRVAKPDGSN
jgi:hypothetical protein